MPDEKKGKGKKHQDDLASVMAETRPRTPKAAAEHRRKTLENTLHKLLKIGSEQLFTETLQKDYGIETNHPRFDSILQIWRERQERY